MRTVLVTGGAGFIGSHQVEGLVSRGNKVMVFDDLSEGKLSNLGKVIDKIKFVQWDVRNFNELRNQLKNANIDTIFHLAVNASVPHSVKDPDYDFNTNALGTLNVLKVAAEEDAKVIVSVRCGLYKQIQPMLIFLHLQIGMILIYSPICFGSI